MRYGIIADIHGNQEALEATLDPLSGKADKIICLGDIIGYGPNPNECCEIIRKNKIASVAGNHEKAVLGELSLELFNPEAKEAAIWTDKILSSENRGYIKNLPIILEQDNFQCVHGSLINPIEEYLMDLMDALPTFNVMNFPLLFVGHTHQPLRLRYGDKQIINPGSVGQPRDGNPDAAYLLFDDETKEMRLYRVKYDVAKVQNKMKEAGLPRRLIERLRFGR